MPEDTLPTPPRPRTEPGRSTIVAGPDPTPDTVPPPRFSPSAPAGESNALPAGPPGYDLLAEVGRGGMGVVYRARDTALGRDVAVKLLHDRYPGGGPAAHRFTEEARITGQLQHPGIPAVHQVGELSDGRPFLAMKLIKGHTLDALLRDGGGEPRRSPHLLGIFEQVCQAVGYAHAHHVVHRDLKPANVMVGAFGEVQVMDWGLAKVLASGGVDPRRPDDESTLDTEIRSQGGADEATRAGSVMGTPAYMPPEQAIGAVDQIDARSDVFGLGAILCAILTGRPPFLGGDAESTRQLAARGKLDDAFARLAACGAEPDLVALAKRCLTAEKADRPADAGVVAAAVAALRAAADDRARRAELDRAAAEVKAVEDRKRRRVFVGLGSMVLATVLAGGGLALAQWRWTKQALGDTAAALADAESARGETLVALRKLTNELVGERAGRQAALTDRDRQFFRDVLGLWEKVAAGRGDTPEAQALRAEGARRVGLIRHRLGEWAEAERAYRDALRVYQPLAADHPAVPAYQHELADTLTNLGNLLKDAGPPGDAERAYRDALAIRRKLAAAHPADPAYQLGLARTHTNLGVLLADTARWADAERLYRDAMAVYQRLAAAHPAVPDYQHELAGTHTNLGVLLADTRGTTEAERAYRDALTVYRTLAAAHPAVPDYQYGLARTLSNLGNLLVATSRPGDAEQAFRDALAAYQKLAAAHPAVPDYQHGLADAHNNLGLVLARTNRPGDAERSYRDALVIYQGLAAAHPTVPNYRRGLAAIHTNLGLLLEVTSPTEAERAYRDALAAWQSLTAAHPTAPDYQHSLAVTHANLGNLLSRYGRPGDAEPALRDALTAFQALAGAHPSVPDYRHGLARTLSNIAILRLGGKQPAEAKRLLEDAATHHRAALAANPRNPNYRRSFRINRLNFCRALLALADHAAVPGCAAEVLEQTADLRTDTYNAAGFLTRCVPLAKGDPALSAAERTDFAGKYADAAMGYLRQAVKLGYKDAAHMRKDSDLAPLRDRADFRQLLAELEAKTSPREVAPPPRLAK